MCGGEGEVLKKGGESRIGRAKLEATTVITTKNHNKKVKV